MFCKVLGVSHNARNRPGTRLIMALGRGRRVRTLGGKSGDFAVTDKGLKLAGSS